MEVAIDIETHRMRPGDYFPKPVCLAFATASGEKRITLCDDNPEWQEALKFWLKECTVIGTNLGWDLGVLQERFPDLRGAVFEAYERGSIIDISISEKLILIGQGKLQDKGSVRVRLGDLENKYIHPSKLAHRGEKKATFTEEQEKIIQNVLRLEGRELRKYLEDNKAIIQELQTKNWRLRFKELENTPVSDWPKEALNYVKADVETPLIIHKVQSTYPDFLGDSANQAKYDFCLKLMQNHGVVTDRQKILEFQKNAQAEFEKINEILELEGLVKRGKKVTLEAKKRMLKARFNAGLPLLLTDKGIEIYGKKRIEKEDLGKLPPQKFGVKPLTQADLKRPPEEWEEIFVLKSVKLDQEACEEAGDQVLSYYSRYQTLNEILTTRVGDLLKGVDTPIQTRFNVLVATGRTSCTKKSDVTNGFQLQNPRREGDERSCFVARPGKLFCSIDYSGLELCTLAQVAYKIIGYSKLGEALNAGLDVHLLFACESLLRISYSEGLRRFHEPEIKHYRQIAKASNFSFPGGQGARSFRDKAYKDTKGSVNLTLREAEEIRGKWFAQFHEIGLLLEHFKSLLRGPRGEQRGSFTQLFSGRIRGGCFFTQLANTSFQGLGADLCKEALWQVTKVCYNDNTSALFGARPWNLLHDEIIAEVDEKRAHEQAFEMNRIMLEAAKKYLPNVTIKAEPALSKHWLKEAVTLYDENNRLIAYDLAKQSKTRAFYSDGKEIVWT